YDVLVFFRRILREPDRAVGTPLEPFRMLLDPGMVRRALDREVERDLEALRFRRFDQALERGEAAKLGMERVMTALLRPDGVGAAGVVGARDQTIVAAFAVGRADGMDGREVKNIEAEVA